MATLAREDAPRSGGRPSGAGDALDGRRGDIIAPPRADSRQEA